MADNLIRMQHSTKASAGFTHGDISVDSDEAGIISIPSHLSGHATAHGFTAVSEKGPKKLEPLAKIAKLGDKDADDTGSSADGKSEGDKDGKTPAKGAKLAKGGE